MVDEGSMRFIASIIMESGSFSGLSGYRSQFSLDSFPPAANSLNS